MAIVLPNRTTTPPTREAGFEIGISLHCSKSVVSCMPGSVWRTGYRCGVRHGNCPAKSYHDSAYPRSGFRDRDFIALQQICCELHAGVGVEDWVSLRSTAWQLSCQIVPRLRLPAKRVSFNA